MQKISTWKKQDGFTLETHLEVLSKQHNIVQVIPTMYSGTTDVLIWEAIVIMEVIK